MSWLLFLKRNWKAIALALLLSTTFSAGWYFSGLRGKAALESERRQVAEDARLQIEAAQKLAYDADERYRKAVEAAPKAAPVIRERTHANPSGCTVPKPVADGLRDAIRNGNEAISR